MINLDALEKLAKAARPIGTYVRDINRLTFITELTPQVVLELIAEVRRLREQPPGFITNPYPTFKQMDEQISSLQEENSELNRTAHKKITELEGKLVVAVSVMALGAEVCENLDALGQAYREDWSDFDGRQLRGEINFETGKYFAALKKIEEEK